MHRLILPIAFVLLLSACSTYQYMTVDSTQLKKDDHSQLTFENDTLRLTWRLEGKGGAEQTTSLFDNNVMIQGNSAAFAYRTGTATQVHTRYAASLSLPEGKDFIPPASSLSRQLPDLQRTGLLQANLADTLREKKLIATDGLNYTRYMQQHFDEDQSPLHFKSYITFSIGNNNPPEFAETCSFYVREICQTSSAPDFFSLYRPQGDQFYITTSSDTR